MDEDDFKAHFIASWLAAYSATSLMIPSKFRSNEDLFGISREDADIAWRLYAASRPKVEDVTPEYARGWFHLNWPGLSDAVMDADHATLLKICELVGYTPMEPR